MNNQYKVGDKVIIRKGLKADGRDYGYCICNRNMLKHLGKQATITKVYSRWYEIDLDNGVWNWTDEMFLPVITDEIHITVKGNKTIAVHKNNGKLVKRAEAICCPSDTFDFEYGAKLAMDRLLEDKPKEEPRFKVGDKAVIVGNTTGHGITGGAIVVVDTVCLGRSGYRVKSADERNGFLFFHYVHERDLEPYTEPEQPKEPIKLYCFKEHENLLSKGTVYDLSDDFIHYDDGKREYMRWFNGNDGQFKDSWLSRFLVPLVSRPAKVGEWVFVTGGKSRLGNNHKYEISKIYKVFGAGINNCVWFDNDCKGNVGEQDYLVLDGYQPKEPFKPYLECDGENYGFIGEKTEITAFAETPLNIGDVVEVAKANGYDVFTSTVANLSNGAGIMGYLSTSKNMKNGSFVNPYRERCYVRKIRDYTELKDGETINGVTAHLTEKGE